MTEKIEYQNPSIMAQIGSVLDSLLEPERIGLDPQELVRPYAKNEPALPKSGNIPGFKFPKVLKKPISVMSEQELIKDKGITEKLMQGQLKETIKPLWESFKQKRDELWKKINPNIPSFSEIEKRGEIHQHIKELRELSDDELMQKMKTNLMRLEGNTRKSELEGFSMMPSNTHMMKDIATTRYIDDKSIVENIGNINRLKSIDPDAPNAITDYIIDRFNANGLLDKVDFFSGPSAEWDKTTKQRLITNINKILNKQDAGNISRFRTRDHTRKDLENATSWEKESTLRTIIPNTFFERRSGERVRERNISDLFGSVDEFNDWQTRAKRVWKSVTSELNSMDESAIKQIVNDYKKEQSIPENVYRLIPKK